MLVTVFLGATDGHGHFLQGPIAGTVQPSIKNIRVVTDHELERISPKIILTVVKKQGDRPFVEFVEGNIQVIDGVRVGSTSTRACTVFVGEDRPKAGASLASGLFQAIKR